MPHHADINRRDFMRRLGAGAMLGAAGAYSHRALAQSFSGGWTPPPILKNPNILIIMVDQMRPPMWLNQGMSAQSIMPNIMGIIQGNSYNFSQFFVAATVCTASRAALLTGLYAPQTAMYVTGSPGASVPELNSAFPTWGKAIQKLNPAYNGNVWWFGKWHLSNELSSSPLAEYGFNTRNYPGGTSAPYNPSPDGAANEGTDGGLFGSETWANDSMIAGDFIGWLQGQPPTSGLPDSPWCATVSLINPHDISYAPAWMQSNSYPPTGVNPQAISFPPPNGPAPAFYGSQPNPWNWENIPQVANKPSLQNKYWNVLNNNDGAVNDWTGFLNQYLWLQNLVDLQVGRVLTALGNSPFANNTVIIFLSDHGEFAGSHGLHTKGFAVYDESIRVPFFVQFPGQSGAVQMNQMCSGVDFFGLICDLATGGSGQWRLAYPDLANRQSMWSFLYNNCSETRVAPSPIGLPYVFHTFDQLPVLSGSKPHIIGMRTKLNASAGQIGAKLAFYYEWVPCTTYPDATTPDPEFYDYNPATTGNIGETGNDFFSSYTATQNTITNYVQAMGTLGPSSTGLIGSELNAPLVGIGTDGNPLSQALATAQQNYYAYALGSGGCPEG